MSSYAGEISPKDAWDRLLKDPSAHLIDVRTQAEWSYVGLPDLSLADKKPLLVSWLIYPAMTQNPLFAQQIQDLGLSKTDSLLFLCRSGVRSKAAAELMTGLGFDQCWNITDGFEGPLDPTRHRGTVAGWKVDGLPWTQT